LTGYRQSPLTYMRAHLPRLTNGRDYILTLGLNDTAHLTVPHVV
jgi:hypothetical protein